MEWMESETILESSRHDLLQNHSIGRCSFEVTSGLGGAKF